MGRRRHALLAGAVTIGLAAVAFVALEARSPSTLDPLRPSDPPELILRALRLAGVEDATVAEVRGRVLTDVRLPVAESSADVTAAWVAALAASCAALPEAKECVVNVFSPGGAGLLQVKATPSAGDPLTEARVAYLAQDSSGDTTRARELSGSTAYLDAKNRAAEAGEGGAVAAARMRARTAAERLRSAAPGVPALASGEDAGVSYARRLLAALTGRRDPSARALRGRALRVSAGLEGDALRLLHARTLAAEGVAAWTASRESSAAVASLFEAVRAVVRALEAAPIPRRGPYAAAVRAAYDRSSGTSPGSSVSGFAREASLDATSGPDGTALPNRVEAQQRAEGGPAGVSYPGGRVAPARWLAYRALDGRVYWLAGDSSGVALTDVSVDGYVWRMPRAALVDAERVQLVLATYGIP